MNIPSSGDLSQSPPRMVCQVARLWNALAGSAVGHCTRCPECQQYFNRARALESALTREAAQELAATPDTGALEHAILRAVRTSGSGSPARDARRAFWGWSVMAGAAAMTLAAVVAFGPNLMVRNDPARAAIAKDDAAVLMTTVQSISSELVSSVIPSAGELVAENPLQHELGSVYSDVRSAIDFLALNFLPATRSSVTQTPARQI